MQDMQVDIPASELVIFEESSRMAFVEESEAYIATMNRFLERIERACDAKMQPVPGLVPPTIPRRQRPALSLLC